MWGGQRSMARTRAVMLVRAGGGSWGLVRLYPPQKDVNDYARLRHFRYDTTIILYTARSGVYNRVKPAR